MTAKTLTRTLGLLLCVALLSAPVLAKKIKTDGNNKESPIKVQKLDFQDSGYGQPGPNSEIRMSTVVKNTSAEDDLKNVLIKLQLRNLAGEVVQEWTKNLAVMKKGATVEFDPGGVYYNYSFNNLKATVEVEHDEVEKEDKKDKE
ncbi:MAG TPA: hypothetical protein EYO33_25820 [Phycisphaerales bacterium]|nr:hypothetical protein [Phycisphaerales bacterium]